MLRRMEFSLPQTSQYTCQKVKIRRWITSQTVPYIHCLLFTGEAILIFLFKFCQMHLNHSVFPTSSLKNILSNLTHSRGYIAKSCLRQYVTYFACGPCKMSGWQFWDFTEKPQEVLWNAMGSVDPTHLSRDPHLHPGFVVLCVVEDAECGSKEWWSIYICFF